MTTPESNVKPYIEISSEQDLAALMGPESGPVVLDLWAPWCGPCMAMGPHFEAVAGRMGEEPITFAKLNTEAHPDLAGRFRVRSIPTVLLLDNGEVEDVLIGAQSAPQLLKRAEWLLSRSRGEGFFTRLFGSRNRAR